MKRYVSMTRAIFVDRDSDPWPALTADLVFETDNAPVSTGILNADGVPIYRVTDRNPIGFDLRPRIRVKASSRRA